MIRVLNHVRKGGLRLLRWEWLVIVACLVLIAVLLSGCACPSAEAYCPPSFPIEPSR